MALQVCIATLLRNQAYLAVSAVRFLYDFRGNLPLPRFLNHGLSVFSIGAVVMIPVASVSLLLFV